MSDIYDWDVAAANNNDAPPNGAPEFMEYDEVNNTMREMMAVIARWQDAAFSGILTAGTQPAYTLISGQTLGAYANGQMVGFLAHATSTGAVTLSVDGLGAVAVHDSRGNQAGSGDIQQNGVYFAVKTSASWRVVGHLSAASVQALVNVTLAAAPTTGGTGNAYTLTIPNFPGAYVNGQLIAFVADRANTGAATINVNVLGAEALQDPDGAALAANDIVTNQACLAARVSGAWRVFAGLPVNLATQVVGTLPVANGGTGATSAAAARTSLGAQAQDADLDAIAAITATKGHLLVGNGTTWAAVEVGANRQIPRADSADAEGVVWSDQIASLATQASTSGSNIDFTNIPAGVNRITIAFDGVSLSGSDHVLVQLGDAGGFETSGYSALSVFLANSSGTTVASTAGFIAFIGVSGARALTGHMVLTRITGTNRWIASHVWSDAVDGMSANGSGSKTLSAELTQLRIDTTGANTFDAGQIAVMYE